MKASKPPPVDVSSNRRSQPIRQTRTNPPRSSANARSNARRDSLGLAGAPAGDQPIDIFPATTFFADIMTALPKDMVRHFTLLKEVDAKISAPQQELFKLVDAAINSPYPEPQSSIAPTSAPMSAQNSSSGLAFASNSNGNGNTAVPPPPSTVGSQNTTASVFDPSNLPRRQLYRQTAMKINDMLVALEEKNHVLNTANDALQKQMARIEDVWPHIKNEYSEEAKYGSDIHWAYPENRTGRNSHPERARRDGAAAISAAAAALAEEAAARSESRKQAVQAKKSAKNNQQESDFDDQGSRGEVTKKPGPGKGRKTNNDNNNIGLGISTALAANGSTASKKRKAEAITNGGTSGERILGAAFGSNASKAKAGSASETPVPEGPKKRKALPSGSGQTKKKNVAATPSAASSPVIGSLPEPKGLARASPAPNATPRQPAARSRQNSLQSNKSRPPTLAAIKANGGLPANLDPPPPTSVPRSGSDARSVKESSVPIKGEAPKKDAETTGNGAGSTPKAINTEFISEEKESRKSESVPPAPHTMLAVTTKSGRASKPSTPALSTFQEAARPRSSRNPDGNNAKKNHKKGTTPAQAPAPPAAADDDQTSADGDVDADEPTYCYCNSVSYGEMVACDSDKCEREWFHLACVGLTKAPLPSSSWFCNDCKERLKMGNVKKSGGR